MGTYLGILCPVLFLVAVPTDGVIIETGIFDQPHPLAPPRRDVAAVVLVEVLPEEGCGSVGVRGEGNMKEGDKHGCVRKQIEMTAFSPACLP